jgi:hypothetical protein
MASQCVFWLKLRKSLIDMVIHKSIKFCYVDEILGGLFLGFGLNIRVSFFLQ